MRLECITIEELLDEIKHEHKNIHRGIVRVRLEQEAERDDNLSFRISVIVTALVNCDGGQYLVEFGQVAGTDWPGSENDADHEGLHESVLWVDQVDKLCDELGLQVRQGRLDRF